MLIHMNKCGYVICYDCCSALSQQTEALYDIQHKVATVPTDPRSTAKMVDCALVNRILLIWFVVQFLALHKSSLVNPSYQLASSWGPKSLKEFALKNGVLYLFIACGYSRFTSGASDRGPPEKHRFSRGARSEVPNVKQLYLQANLFRAKKL